MNKIQTITKTAKRHLLTIVMSFGVFTTNTQLVSAQFADEAKEGIEDVSGTAIDSDTNLLETIVNTLLFLAGAVSVIMIIIGGIRYIVSSGDTQASANARNTILYSIVGLVVAVVAWGIVNWVLGRLYGTTPPVTP